MQKPFRGGFHWLLVAVAFALAATGAGIVVQNHLVEESEQLAQTVAQSLLPALLANDATQVNSVLKSLEAYPGVVRIELVSSEGAPIATFARLGEHLNPSLGYEFELASADSQNDDLQVVAPITYDTLILANLHIAVNLWPTYLRLISWIGLLLIVPSAVYIWVKKSNIKIRMEAIVKSDSGFRGDPTFDMSAILQQAMDDADIKVEFQPVERSVDGGIFGIDPVVTWHHPSGQTLHLSPADFVGLTKKWELFLPVEHWIWETACRSAAAWQRQYGPLVMSFNLSAEQLTSPDLFDAIHAICEKTHYPHQLLEFEVSEAVLSKVGTPKELAQMFTDHGWRLTLGHFGLGRYSQDYIEHLSIGRVKLDAKLVANIDRDEQIQNWVGKIADLCHGRDIQMASDGVHRQSQKQILQEMGCDLLKGGLVSGALSVEQFEKLLQTRSIQVRPQFKQSVGIDALRLN